MSPNTITAPAYTIRERLASDSPMIEGVVDNESVIVAIKALEPRSDTLAWFLVTYVDIAASLGVRHPDSAWLTDEEHARHWVTFITALYAQRGAATEPVDVLLDDEPPTPAIRELAEEFPAEVGNSRFLADLVDTEVGHR